MADPFTEAVGLAVDVSIANARTATPGLISKVTRDADGELDVDFEPGPGRRQGGEVTADGIVASAPMLYPGGGGYGITWPMETGDEALAVVADHNTQTWRQNRTPGAAHAFDRTHNISDALVLPMTIRSPVQIGDTWKLTGPAGIAIEIAGDGTVTISSNASQSPSTITMDAEGNVSIAVGLGKTIDLGGSAVSPATKWTQLDAAMSTFIDALVAAGAGPTYAGAGAAKLAWEGALAAASPAATKVEVE